MNILEKALGVMEQREFIGLATANKKAVPNAAPKLLLKSTGKTIYFVDYSFGRTAENLRENPQVSFCLMDHNALIGYRLTGSVEIIEKGKIYEECLKELREKQISLSVERVLKAVQQNTVHKGFEVEIPERFLLYKVTVEEAVEITPRGEVKR